MIDINYKQSGSAKVRCTVLPSDKSVYKKELMKEEYILLCFSSPSRINFAKGDYIDTEFGHFELIGDNPPAANKTTGGYNYELRLDSPIAKWKNYMFFYSRGGNKEKSWKLTDRLSTFSSILEDNLERAKIKYIAPREDGSGYIEKSFTVAVGSDVTDANKIKPLNFDSTSIFDAVTAIAEAWGTEWYVSGNVITFGKCELKSDIVFDDNVLSDMSRGSGDPGAVPTRIYPFGSTRNIPANYRPATPGMAVDGVVQRRLMLPASYGKDYVDIRENLTADEIIEAVVTFEDVYPKMENTVTSVACEEVTVLDDQGNPLKGPDGQPTGEKYYDYTIETDLKNFSEEYKLDDLRLAFQTGRMAGLDFVLQQISSDDHKTVFKIIRNTDYQRELPNDTIKPAVGDKFVLYGFDTKFVDDQLVGIAEQELLNEARKYVQNLREDNSVYTCKTNVIYCSGYTLNSKGEWIHNAARELDLDIGNQVKLVNDLYFGSQGRISRIYAFEKSLTDKFDCTYQVGETPAYSRIGQLESKVDEIIYNGNTFSGTSSGGGGVYLISRFDSTNPSDFNAYSALRSKEEFLSRKNEDKAEAHITFENGILVKTSQSLGELRSQISSAITEEGNDDPGFLSQALIEEGNGNPELLSMALMENTDNNDGGFLEGGTLGSLENVNSTFDTLPDGKYTFEMRNGIFFPVVATSIGGGGSNVMRLTFVSSGVIAVGHGNAAVIKYNFVSTMGGEPTGNGTATYSVNNRRVFTGTIPQGENSFDVGPYLDMGNNSVVVGVTDSEGTKRSLTYSINAVNMFVGSTFDPTVPITDSTFSFRYTPIGSVLKTVHFKIDGEEVATYETIVSNRQMNQVLPNKGHGNHLLEVYMTATVDGAAMESNHLFYDLICLQAGNNTPVISSSFMQKEAEQYTTLVIPYSVYNPAGSESDVLLVVDGVTVSELRVDRTQKWWNYRLDKPGNVELKIVCGTVQKVFSISVTKSSINAEAETADLQVFYSSMGRSNSEVDKEEWVYTGTSGTVTAQMTGFNWVTNGWLPDENGNVALKLSGDARVQIPLKVFEKDIRLKGKTIEIEFSTSDVVDYESVIATCWNNEKGFKITAQEAIFAGDSTTVEAKFKEDERIRVSFVIEERAENRLLYTYINGINSGTKQYAENESFTQVDPQDIILGSNDCVMNIYSIRVYDNNLTQYQILDNYIADMDDTNRKIQLYERNRLYDDYGDLNYDKVCNQIPCMTIIGPLPQYKGDKKTVEVKYEDRLNPAQSFDAANCQIDVQGTSSQYYPRKNYKTKFRSGFTMAATGEHTDGYKLTENSIPVNVFCEKADFAESSGTHNTGLANLMNDTLKSLGFLTPPQKTNPLVRTTVEGFPIVIFHRETEDAPAEFVGKYNFNTDKAAEESFGFTDPSKTRCIELRNNTSTRVLFQESEFEKRDANGKPEWMADFEFRYPDDDDFNKVHEEGKIPEDFKRFCDWVVACKGNPVKFRNEAAQYFDINNFVSYYCLTELLGMVDQRAKNVFFTTWDGLIWYVILYDNDTCLGINNEGEIVFNYNIETGDVIGSQSVWNADKSELWKNVAAAFAPEIEAVYKRLRIEDILSYEKVYNYMNANQSDKWSESIYNADGKFKYIDPLTQGYYDYGQNGYIYTGEYLYALQGSRADHRKWWLFNRFRYMDSKYNTGQYFGDTATMRLYTPSEWTGVAPNADFTLVPYTDQYLRVRYGSVDSSVERAAKNETKTIKAPANTTFNDTETIIYGASRLKSVGNLASKYPGTVDMSSATKLEELIIGSNVPGYKNTNLRNVVVKSNKLLRRINIENCPAFTDSLNLSGCENIEEVYAAGSGITSIVLPGGGTLVRLELPGTVTVLEIKNQIKLDDHGFVMPDISKLQKLILENVNFNVFNLLDRCFQVSPQALQRVRLINISGSTYSSDSLGRVAQLAGVDVDGSDIRQAVVTGECNVDMIYYQDFEVLQSTFPELTMKYRFLCVKFPDPEFKRVMVSKIDVNSNGEIDWAEAQEPREFGAPARDNKLVKSIEGIEYINYKEPDDYHIKQFMGCTSLQVARFPLSTTRTAHDMFTGCTSLVEIKFNPNMTVIAPRTFNLCTSLKNVNIPSSVYAIKESAFYSTAVEKVVLPDSITELGGRVFAHCHNLREFDFGDGHISTIGQYIFLGCENLKKVTFGKNVQYLGPDMFRAEDGYNPTVETVIIKNPVPPTTGFNALGATALVYVPDEAVSTYKAATYFSGIKGRIYPMSQLPN